MYCTLPDLDLATISAMQRHAETNKRTSEKYATVPTLDLLNKVNRVLDDNGVELASVSLLRQRKLGRGSIHAVQYTCERHMTIQGDDIKPRIIIVNSFNGERALTVLCGIFRLVCSNGLVVGSTLYRERAIHVKGETIEAKLGALESKVNDALQWISIRMQSTISDFLSIPTPLDSQVRIVRGLDLSKRLTDGLIHTFQAPDRLRVADQGRNAWATYNVINEAIDRSSRSEIARLNKNITLMDDIRELALAN